MAALHLGAAAFTADEGLEIDTRIFNFILSPFDHRMISALAYAQSTVLTETFVVPGSQPPRTTSRGKTHLLVFFRRWFGCVRTMHQAGYSLRGQFTAANFMISAALQIKVNAVHLFPYSREDGGLDYTSLVSSMEQILVLRESVPPHLREWLDLIAEGVNGYEDLIRYHSAVMEPKQAFDFVLEGRVILEQLRIINPQLFDQILSCHPQLIDWDVDSNCVNSYMSAARTYRVPHTGQPIQFEGDLTGVLTLGRHCSVHPARNLKEFMVFIFEDDFPGLVSGFQLSIFRAGLLPIFRLEVTMA